MCGYSLLALTGRAAGAARLSEGRSVYLYADWRYSPGDHAEWADPWFDDSSWEKANPYKLPEDGWEGIGWFRLRVVVDTTLLHTPLSLSVVQAGASEVYLDGALMQSIGRAGTTAAEEKPRRTGPPRILSFERGTDHLLAVRYSNFSASGFRERGMEAGFRIHLSGLRSRDAIVADVERFMGDAPQADDITVVVMRVL